MARVNITDLAPWDLTISIGDDNYATVPPTWNDVLHLDAIEKRIESVKATSAFEPALREAIKRFFPEATHGVVDKLRYYELQAILAAASAYFSDWLKKKQQAAIAAVRPPAAGPESGK